MIDDPLNKLKVKRGTQLKQSRLTEDDVRLIRSLVEYREGLRAELSNITNRAIAEKFDVHQRTIDKIITGKSWTHV